MYLHETRETIYVVNILAIGNVFLFLMRVINVLHFTEPRAKINVLMRAIFWLYSSNLLGLSSHLPVLFNLRFGWNSTQ